MTGCAAQVPGGLRMGTPALTSRGFVEADFDQVADFVHRCAAGPPPFAPLTAKPLF